jgi:hypothetical protein
VPEGRGQMLIQFLDHGSYQVFYLSPKIEDSESITVGVQRTRNGDVIDAVRLRIGDPAVATATSPSFRLSVLNIEQ